MLDFLFGPPRQRLASDGRGWRDFGAPRARFRTTAGVQVDEELALTYAAVWCATRILSETTASLPLILYRRHGQDRAPAVDHPLYHLVKQAPNPRMGSMALREGRTMHQVNWGNGFAEIERERLDDPTSPVVALHPIHAARVEPVRAGESMAQQGFAYRVRNDSGQPTLLRAEEMLHVPGALSEDGIWGKGVISHARESIGFGISTERHGARYFGSGGQPKAVITGTGLRDPQQRANFRAEWKDMHGSPDSAEVALLPVDAKYEPITVGNQDAQFLETRRHNVTEIARWYRLPPHMIGDLERATFANIEQEGINFVVYSLFPWPRRWEEALNRMLAPHERAEYYWEHNFGGLLRGDVGARMNAYRTAIMIGLMTINECRRLENLPGIGQAGDVNYVPLNMTTAERMLAGLDLARPGAKSAPGSDQAGGEPDDQKAFDRWTRRRLRREERRRLGASLRMLEEQAGRKPVDQLVTRAAAQAVVGDALARMLTKEANAARRLAGGKNVDLDAWLAAFYGKHRAVLAAALEPSAQVLRCLGHAIDPAAVADGLIAASRAELRAAYGQDTPEAFVARLGRWPTERAAQLTATLLAGGSIHARD